MKEIFLLDDAIISPLGLTTEENLAAVKKNLSALQFHSNKRFTAGGFYAGIIECKALTKAFSEIGNPKEHTKLEQMMILAVHQILKNNPQIDLTNTALIISSTKGNIQLLEDPSFPEERVYLSSLAEEIKKFFKFKLKPIVISNACISGGLAIAVAKRFIAAGKFEQAIIVGGDVVSNFVVSGFQSFQAISDQPCKPFSASRNGISLGEAAAALLVSLNPRRDQENICITGEASANDANHISGPSRTGEGLYLSIEAALREANISAEKIDYLSAHGTATVFNDEMEAIAFYRAGLQEVPVNSFKGYYGHTLGASALLESILTKHSLLRNEIFRSVNFDSPGTTKELNVITENKAGELHFALKTASGFGGGNLALVFQKK